MNPTAHITHLGDLTSENGLRPLAQTSDGHYKTGTNGVNSIATTGDGKVELVSFDGNSLACVKSALAFPAYYPLHPTSLTHPVNAVMMDLDGTSVRSEEFWIWIIELTTASLLGDKSFAFEAADIPFVSGHSVSEHLSHCIKKYCPGASLADARQYYFEHTHREMQAIMDGHGRKDAFSPTPGLKDFLLELKAMDIKIGLVTSGLYEKAWPEILSAFRTLNMGDPAQFYDAIITAGYPLRKGQAGTLGELAPKPHPWLYAECAVSGLGIPFTDRNSVLGIEDSGAGVCSIRIAGYPTAGIGGGNIKDSGTLAMCDYYCEDLAEIMNIIKGK